MNPRALELHTKKVSSHSMRHFVWIVLAEMLTVRFLAIWYRARKTREKTVRIRNTCSSWRSNFTSAAKFTQQRQYSSIVLMQNWWSTRWFFVIVTVRFYQSSAAMIFSNNLLLRVARKWQQWKRHQYSGLICIVFSVFPIWTQGATGTTSIWRLYVKSTVGYSSALVLLRMIR